MVFRPHDDVGKGSMIQKKAEYKQLREMRTFGISTETKTGGIPNFNIII